MSTYRMTELALQKLKRHPYRLDFIKSLHMIASDEVGQKNAEFDEVIDNILRITRGVNMYYGGILGIGTYDPTQLQPIQGRPLLVSLNIIPCYKVVPIKHFVRTQDSSFFRLQQIARLSYNELRESEDLQYEFERLCEKFTFADSWDDPSITPGTFRIYAKNIPAKTASKDFVRSVKNHIQMENYRERKAIDLQRYRFSNESWKDASAATVTTLDAQMKEPGTLLFFQSAIYQCTYTEDGLFSQSQLALCYDLPDQDDLDNFRRIKVLLFPHDVKLDGFEFDSSLPKSYYIDEMGFKEVSIGQSPHNIISYDDTKASRKQYGLRHYVTATIHGAMGDTYNKMAASISDINEDKRLWDRGQLIVLISRTRKMENTIFVGPKNESIKGLKCLLTYRTQWCEYMDEVLKITTIKRDDDTDIDIDHQVMNQRSYPFRICDISLPQDRTGYVYFLMSKRDKSFVHIGMTFCLRSCLIAHNSGRDCKSSSTPTNKRPYVLIAYICGFDRNKDLMISTKEIWFEERHDDIFEWAKNGRNIIVGDDDLRLIYLLRD